MSLKGSAFNGSLITGDGRLRAAKQGKNSSPYHLGGTGNDIVQLGAGTDTAALSGNNDSIHMGAGNNQSVTINYNNGINELIADGQGSIQWHF